jgi:hypothetical protein
MNTARALAPRPLVRAPTRVSVRSHTGNAANASGSSSRCSQSHNVAVAPLIPVHGQWWL